MKYLRSVITAVALAGLVAFVAGAEDVRESTEAEASVKLKPQTHCPVMGGEIDSTVYTDIQGQRVYHCCPACSESLKADPDKYFRQAAMAGVLFENIQTTCPVGGEKLKDKSIYSDYEGRRVVFCGSGCREAFAVDPEKYLKAMDSKPRATKGQCAGGSVGCRHSCGVRS